MRKEIYISVDQSEPISLEELIRVNTGENVEEITDAEIKMIENMRVGQTIHIGIVQVKRLR